jgi:cytochrome c5
VKYLAYSFAAATALALIAGAQAQTPPAAAPAAAASGGDELPAAPERDFVVQTCTACHTSAQFSSQRLDHDGWKAIVEKMISYGANVPEDKEEVIVGYLAKSFPASK